MGKGTMLSMQAHAVAILIFLPICFAADKELTGTVFMPDGRPAADTQVLLYYLHDESGYGTKRLSEGQTDEQGRFRLQVPPFEAPPLVLADSVMRFLLVARHRGVAPGFSPVSLRHNEGYEIYLSEGQRVTCRVTDGKGQPVAGVNVHPYLFHIRAPGAGLGTARWAMWAVLRELYSVRTDERGTAVFEDLPTEVAVFAGWHEELGWTYSKAAKGGTCELEIMSDLVKLEGRVTDAQTGKPVEGLLVKVSYDADFPNNYIFTEKNGLFTAHTDLGSLSSSGIVILDPLAAPRYAPMTLCLEEEALRKLEASFEKGKTPARMPTLKIECKARHGETLRCKVTNKETGHALRGAPVQSWVALVKPDGAPFEPAPGEEDADQWADAEREGFIECEPAFVGRLTDAEGECVFQCQYRRTEVWVAGPPMGFALLDTRQSPTGQPQQAHVPGACELSVEALPEAAARLLIRSADGAPSAFAAVNAKPYRSFQTTYGYAAVNGRLSLAGLPEGTEIAFYAISADGAQAAFQEMRITGGLGAGPLPVTLQPARTGRVALRDEAGNNIKGHASVSLKIGEKDRSAVLGIPRFPIAREGEGEARVPGLLPGRRYRVWATADGNAFVPQEVEWEIAEADKEPTLLVRLEQKKRAPAGPRIPGPPVAAPPQQAPAEKDFEKDLQALGDAQWKKEDPIQKELTWYGLDGGVALADAQHRRVERYTKLFEDDALTVADVAFAPQKVWFATSAGLLAWDRELRYWTWYPAPANLSTAGTKVTMQEDGRVLVTLQGAHRAAKRLVFDPQTARWSEVK